jgi:hypothetical protein
LFGLGQLPSPGFHPRLGTSSEGIAILELTTAAAFNVVRLIPRYIAIFFAPAIWKARSFLIFNWLAQRSQQRDAEKITDIFYRVKTAASSNFYSLYRVCVRTGSWKGTASAVP